MARKDGELKEIRCFQVLLDQNCITRFRFMPAKQKWIHVDDALPSDVASFASLWICDDYGRVRKAGYHLSNEIDAPKNGRFVSKSGKEIEGVIYWQPITQNDSGVPLSPED